MASPNGPTPHIPYKIIDQREAQTFKSGKGLEDVWEVEFEGPSGHAQTIRLPLNQADPASVDSAIEEELERTEGIEGLGPQPHPENLAS